MKYLLLCALAVSTVSAAPREKRFAALGLATSGLGGATGCVVTGNTLYANGIKLRELTSGEQSEMNTYQTQLTDYKKQLKAALEARRETMKRRMQGDESEMEKEVAKAADLKAPTKPSFCSEDITTQYIFDGCLVQGNKVYVGKEYARDLTSDEVQQLKNFDSKMTVYQKYAQKQMQKQMKGLFGGSDFFSALFSDQVESSGSAVTTTEEPTETAPEAPEAPKFCTAIY